MRRFIAFIILSLFTWAISSSAVFAGEGYENIIIRWMKRGNMSNDEIKVMLSLPRDIEINEEMNAILPGAIFHISSDGRSGYTYRIPDTIWGKKVFPNEARGKK